MSLRHYKTMMTSIYHRRPGRIHPWQGGRRSPRHTDNEPGRETPRRDTRAHTHHPSCLSNSKQEQRGPEGEGTDSFNNLQQRDAQAGKPQTGPGPASDRTGATKERAGSNQPGKNQARHPLSAQKTTQVTGPARPPTGKKEQDWPGHGDGESHLARRLTMGTKTLDDIFMTWDTRSPREAGYLPRHYSLQKDARP